MIPVYMARGLADGRRQERLAGAERRRLVAALPAGPAALAPRAYEARAF